jgi:DNA-binding IclR family transcriptional regulator
MAILEEMTTRYSLGVKLLERAAFVKRDLGQFALPYLRQLHELFDETVNLGILDKEQIPCIEMLENPVLSAWRRPSVVDPHFIRRLSAKHFRLY